MFCWLRFDCCLYFTTLLVDVDCVLIADCCALCGVCYLLFVFVVSGLLSARLRSLFHGCWMLFAD